MVGKQKRVLVVGGGITGLALAGLLERHSDVQLEIVEKMTSWQLSGYGITVMPIGLEVLRELGVLGQARGKGYSAQGLSVMTADGEPIHHFALRKGGVDTVSMARADLHKILRSHVKHTKIQMGREVTKLHEKDGEVTVTFADGSKGKYDLVVGTDGIRSTVRQQLFPEVTPHYSGTAVWTFFLPKGAALPSQHNVTQIWNDNEFVGIFPFRGRAAVTFSHEFDTHDDVRQTDLEKQFGDMHVLAQDILQKVSKKKMYSGYLNEVKLHDWYKGRILLAGDAAHAMLPATGMGSSMGMADAREIARLVTSMSLEQWDDLPHHYQVKRKRQVDRVQWEAAMITRTMFLPGPLKFLRNRATKLVPQFVVSTALNDGVGK